MGGPCDCAIDMRHTVPAGLLLLLGCGDPAGESDASTGDTGTPNDSGSEAGTSIPPTTSAPTTTMSSSANTTVGTTADTSTGDADSSTGDAPVCTDDDDCPTNTTCDEATGACVCDAEATTCLGELPPGHWIELADTALSSVFPPPRTVPGNPGAIIDAWSGAVYDRDRNRMMVWGGGHADYSGNEVYVFDLASLAWTRLDDPSLDVGGDETTGYYPDGRPRSRHTYDYLAYVPELGSMCSAGGAGMWMSGQVGVGNLDCYDPDTLTWSARASAAEGTIAGIADYDEVTGSIAYVLGPQLRYLATYDVAADAWTSHGDNFTNGGLGIRLTGRVHPTARLFVAVGGSVIYTWDLDTPGNVVESSVVLADPPPDFERGNPGLDYDAMLDRIVWWGSGSSLWSLDLDAGAWVEHPVVPENTVVPPPPVGNGTFGRFRYAITDDVFVLVNNANDNVFVRRR